MKMDQHDAGWFCHFRLHVPNHGTISKKKFAKFYKTVAIENEVPLILIIWWIQH